MRTFGEPVVRERVNRRPADRLAGSVGTLISHFLNRYDDGRRERIYPVGKTLENPTYVF